MRKFLIVLLGVVVLLVVLDRAAAFVAEREIGTRVQSAYDLPQRPHVTVRGFPFLTQVASGNYQQVDVTIPSASADGVQLKDISAQFTGVHASLSLLLGQDSGTVTASQAAGTALIPFSQVQRRLPQGIKIAPDGGDLSVTGTTSYGTIRGTARLGVSGGDITVTPQQLSVAGISAGSLASRFTLTIPVGVLPLHLTVTGVHVTAGGVVVDASAHDVEFARG
jgi:LmeA-like phospholipid-binding